MEQFVQQIAQKTGVDAGTVQKVIQEAVSLVKGHLPAGMAGQVDSLLGNAGGGTGGQQSGDSGGGLGGMLGGLMGGNK